MGEGRRSQESGHKHGFKLGTSILLGGQGRGVSENGEWESRKKRAGMRNKER